jgi:hypothetical protein
VSSIEDSRMVEDCRGIGWDMASADCYRSRRGAPGDTSVLHMHSDHREDNWETCSAEVEDRRTRSRSRLRVRWPSVAPSSLLDDPLHPTDQPSRHRTRYRSH